MVTPRLAFPKLAQAEALHMLMMAQMLLDTALRSSAGALAVDDAHLVQVGQIGVVQILIQLRGWPRPAVMPRTSQVMVPSGRMAQILDILIGAGLLLGRPRLPPRSSRSSWLRLTCELDECPPAR